MVKINKVRIKQNGDNYRLLIPAKIKKEINIDEELERFSVLYENGNLRITKDVSGEFKINDGSYLNFNKVFQEYLSTDYTYIESNGDKEFIVFCETPTQKGIVQLTKSEMLIMEIRKLADMNVDLLPKNIKKNYIKQFNSAGHYFGSWKKAVIASGVKYPEYNRSRKYGFKKSKEQVLEELKKLHKDGVILTSSNIFNHYQPLYKASRNYYSSWKDILIDLEINHSEELKKSNNNLITCGQFFESIVNDLLVDLGFKYQKYQIKNKKIKPDYIFNKFHWGDAKLSDVTALDSRCKTINKYEKHCRFLTIIFYRGNQEIDKMVTAKTRLISVYKLTKQLPKSKKRFYMKKLEDLEVLMSTSEDSLNYIKYDSSVKEKIESCIQNINLEDYQIIKYKKSNLLSPNDVIKIKELIRMGFHSTEISKHFNLHKTTVRDIKNNKSWKGIIHKSNVI